MISEKLGAVYSALEEKYYAVLDFLDAKGVPVYTYNDFLEEHGLPAFPVTVALLVLAIAGIYGLLFVGTGVNPAITLTFEDQFNEAVSGVSVSVKDSSGNLLLAPNNVSNGGTIELQGIPLGTELVLVAEKKGFDKAEKSIVVKREEITASIAMQKQVSAIDAEIQLVDRDTRDLVRGAKVSLEWQGQTKNMVTDSAGKAKFAGIPGSTSVYLSIQADGYETLSGNYSFASGELKEIGLVAGSASFSGMSSLVVSVFDEAGQPVRGAKAVVRDRDTDTSLEERTLEESEAVFSIAKGKSIRVVVEKEGFLSYDSMEEGESRTMRQDEELWPVVLKKGGSRLAVAVFSGQNPLSDATVQLFDVNGNFVNEDVTGFGGSVEFTGLGPKEYFATGYRQGFLPARQLVNVAGTETVSLSLDSADNSNSAYLGISVLDSYRAMANNAGLSFREKFEGELLPLGIPSLKTDISGYASIVARTGTLVVAEAKKEGEEGTGEKLVEANKENQMVIELARPVGIVELIVLDAEGSIASGHVLIESVSGLLLFDGNLLDGRVFFDAEGYSEAMVAIKTDAGETFSQKVNLEGKETVEISLGEASSGLAPAITFVGLFDSDNQPAQGLAKGKEYWLAFQSTWPSGAEKGGVHIRLGQDGIAFVDSEEAGITGFEAGTSNYFYGKSFQPLPAPGNETADKQNAGMPGQLNKFVELYFDSPENTIAFRVKAKANNSISKETVELHYRAWVEAAGSVYRSPNDSELGEKMFTETKTGLYAQALDAELKVFEAEASCAQELCAGYFFVMPTGLYVERQEFSAVTGETYALEIDLSSSKPVSITLKLDTDKASPKIQFTGYDVDDFVDQQKQDPLSPETSLSGQGYMEFAPETAGTGNPLGFKTGGTGTSITINALGVSPERPRKVRAYFTGAAEGKAEIKMQAVAQSVLGESFVFNVERNKELLVSVSPASPDIGQAFTVKVLDGETGDYVQDATVQVKNAKLEIVDSLVGRGSTRRGLRGEYYFKNSFGPGVYSIVVSASGYRSEQLEVAIARDGLLVVNSPVKIGISGELSEKSIALAIRNNAGEDVKELAYEIEKDSDFPEEFSVSVSMPAVAGKGQDTTANIRVIVNKDEDSDESLYGEASLVLKGMVAGNYPTKTVARLEISYNKQLDSDCLYFDSQSLLVRLIGRAGSTATEEFEVENKCGTALDLRATVEALQEDPNLTVSVSPLRIEKGAVEKVKVTVSNRIERNYDLQNRRDYRIKLESSQIAKTIPLSVELWNPRTNLSYPPNITLWMVRSAAEELAFAQSPLQVVNNGAVPVTAFRAAVTPEAYMQGISVGIKPDNIYDTTIYPGQPLSPERYVYAESKRTDAMQKAGQGWITFTGVIEGRQYPDLGRTTLGVNYSGTKCLKASAVDSLVFSSTEAGQGTLERKIKIRNECGEPIRLTEKVVPETIGGNSFVLNAPYTLAQGQEIEARLILMKRQEASRSATIKVVGILQQHNESIESNELTVTLKLGELAATTEGKHTAELSIKKCDSDERKNIAFPVLSSDCSSGYCDAEQLAKFLVGKADTLVKTAKDKAGRANYSTENFSNCAQASKESCSFYDMGIITEQFPVFLQLDYMTEDVLLKALGESKELKGYDVVQGAKSVGDIGSVGFAFGNVHLGGTFKGCGKYYVQLAGAARVSNREIVAGKDGGRDFVVAINVTQQRVTTEECQPRVENMSNFLPVDTGYTVLQNYHAWPGFVQASEEFDSLGKKFAEELFGKAGGRYGATISSASNRLEIVKGNEGNGLLKIVVPKTGQADEPKTMYAHVPVAYIKEMEGDIAKALKAFQQKAFSEEDCWGEDDSGQYIVMKSYKDIDKLYGKLEIEGAKTLGISNEERCTDMNISSKAPEMVRFSTDFLTEGKNPNKDSVEYVAIKDSKGNVLLQEFANGKKTQGPELRLAKEKEESGVYKATFSFCVKGGKLFSLASNSVKDVSITGNGSATPDRKTEPYNVALDVCGMHPYDLVKKMGQVELKEIEGKDEKKLVAYVTVGWSDGPDSIDIIAVQRAVAAEAAMDEAKKRYGASSDIPVAEQPAYIQEIAARKLKGIVSYFVPCAITSAIYGAVMHFGWGAIIDVSLDCAVPALWASRDAVKDLGGAGETMVEGVEDFIKRFVPFASKFIEEEEGKLLLPEKQAEEEAAQAFKENILPAAIFGVSADSIRLGVTNGGQFISKSSADVAGKQVSEAVFKELKKGSLKDLANATGGTTILGDMQKSYAEKIARNLVDAAAADPKTVKFIDQAIVSSSKTAYGEMGEEMANTIMSNAGLLGKNVEKSLRETKIKIIDNFLDEGRVVSNGKLGIGSGSLEVPGFATQVDAIAGRTVMHTDLQNKMVTNIINDLKSQSPELKDAMIAKPAFATNVETAIRNGLDSALTPQIVEIRTPIAGGFGPGAVDISYKVRIDPGDLDIASRKALANLRTGAIADELAENVVGKNIGKEFAEKILTGDTKNKIRSIADDVIDPKLGAGRLSKLKTEIVQWQRFVSWRSVTNLVKNLAKGVAGGVLANWVGYQGWQWYWDNYGVAKVEGAERVVISPAECIDRDGDGRCNEDPINGIDDDKDGLVDEDYPLLASQTLERGQTYRLEITADAFGKTYRFVKVGKEGFGTMDKEIADKKAVLWEEEGCKNFRQKGLGNFLGNLAPVPSKAVAPAYVMAYYNYNSFFADAARGSASDLGDDLHEDELAAVLFVEPERIAGCSISKEWHLRAQGESEETAKARAKESIDCAAGNLRNAQVRAGAGASFRKVLEELVKGQQNTGNYIEIASETQGTWERFRILKPQ